MKTLQITFFILILGMGQVAGTHADRVQLNTSGAVVGDNLGSSVAVSGNFAIVGVPNDDGDAGKDSGSVRLYVRSDVEWVQLQKLLANDSKAGARFGASVAIDGDYAIVGASGHPIGEPGTEDVKKDAGAAYIFVRQGAGWTQQAKLVSADVDAADFFGVSVAIDGDTAIVGAHRHNWPKADGGAAYIFVRNGSNWTQQEKLTPEDTVQFDYFGFSVSVSGDSAIIGCIRNDHNGNDSGAAYIFERDGTTWTQGDKVVGNNTGSGDRFGFAVDISGNFAIVGCPNNGRAGAAYIFERVETKWVQQQSRFQKRILPERKVDGAAFGSSVAIREGIAVIGASSENAAYVFTSSTLTPWEQQARLSASDGVEGDGFGSSVSVSGNKLAAGAPGHSAGGNGSGATYIFELEEAAWQQQSKLSDNETAAEDQFGYAVAIGGDLAVVGARQDDDGGSNAGSAYIFGRRRLDWTRQAKLIANDIAPGDLFGYSAAISGETAVIGAFGQDAAGRDSGAVYIFVRSGLNWIQQAKLIGTDIGKLDHFGESIAIDGDTVIIGASRKDNISRDSGAVYIFVRNGTTWTQEAKLQLDTPVAGDLFGYSVAISGNTAVVGAHSRDEAGQDAGAAYVFVRNAGIWILQAQLISPDAGIGDEFGFAVAVSGDTTLISAPKDDRSETDTGSVYVFVRRGTDWIQQAKLIASDAEANDEFGSAVAFSEESAIIGAWKDGEEDTGSVYTFLRSNFSWTQKRLISGGTGQFDRFGFSVGISGHFAVVGAFGSDASGKDSGSASIFNGVDLGFLPEDFFRPVDPTSLEHTTLGQIKHTALLQNYPNPFNPETWLPYVLAEKAPVIIRIYDIKGLLVRELDLGIQQTGVYFGKEKAAYWDGKDQLGRTVSSGIYFYTLTAGDFQATRSMVILK
jgi:hypothetical protein